MSEKVFKLPFTLYCKKHSKPVEYFGIDSQNNIHLFCSSCIFKKDLNNCEPDNIKDISEYLYDQQQIFDKKGLLNDPQIYKYYVTKEKRDHDYKELTKLELFNFQEACDSLLQRIEMSLKQLKVQMKEQFEEYNRNYIRQSSKLQENIQNSFQQKFISKFDEFNDLIGNYDTTTDQGVKELLYNLSRDQQQIDSSISEKIQQQYSDIIQLENQMPTFNKIKFDEISQYFNVFQDKMQASLNFFINLSGKNIQKDQQIDSYQELQQSAVISDEIDLVNLRKIQCSGNFSSTHSRTVYCIKNIGNNKFATGSDDGLIKIWDLISMDCELTLKGHTGGIRNLEVLQNGNIVSASYDKTLRIWDINLKQAKKIQSQNGPSPHLIKTLTGHLSSVLCIQTLTNNTIASGSSDYTIKVWNAISGAVEKTFSGHMNDVLCLAKTNKSCKFLFSGSSDKQIKAWNMARKFSSACYKTFTGHTDYIWSLAVTMDDTTLISGSVDKTIKLWDIESGLVIMNLIGHTSSITQVQQYAPNIIVSCSGDSTIRFWDTSLKMVVHTLEGHKGACYSFAKMGDNSILSSGVDKQILVWD